MKIGLIINDLPIYFRVIHVGSSGEDEMCNFYLVIFIFIYDLVKAKNKKL